MCTWRTGLWNNSQFNGIKDCKIYIYYNIKINYINKTIKEIIILQNLEVGVLALSVRQWFSVTVWQFLYFLFFSARWSCFFLNNLLFISRKKWNVRESRPIWTMNRNYHVVALLWNSSTDFFCVFRYENRSSIIFHHNYLPTLMAAAGETAGHN